VTLTFRVAPWKVNSFEVLSYLTLEWTFIKICWGKFQERWQLRGEHTYVQAETYIPSTTLLRVDKIKDCYLFLPPLLRIMSIIALKGCFFVVEYNGGSTLASGCLLFQYQHFKAAVVGWLHLNCFLFWYSSSVWPWNVFLWNVIENRY